MTSFDRQLHPYIPGAHTDHTWGARFTFERPHSLTEVIGKLGDIVTNYAHPEWPLSGAVHGTGDATDRSALVLGLDPSQRYGTPDTDRCEEIAARIAGTLNWERQPDDIAAMRVILGRRIGYDGEVHGMEAVHGFMIARGCGNIALAEADLFSLRYVDGLREHHEPGVIIEGAASDLGAVMHVAADMGQERLVSEITGMGTQVWRQ